MRCDEKINGANVYIKSITDEDNFDFYLFWLRDPDIIKFLEVRLSLPHNKDDLKRYVEKQNKSNDSLLFGIFKKDNTFIGTIRLSNISKYHKTCDLGFMIGDKTQHKKGYAFDAIQCAIAYSKNILDIRKIYAGCYSENNSSSRLLKKLDFNLAATLKKHWVVGRNFNDQLIYERFL